MIYAKRIGIDVGGVLRAKSDESSSAEEYLAGYPLENALETVKAFVGLYGAENIFIISRCPEFAEDLITQWLDQEKLFTDIGFDRSNVHYCLERADKADIAKQLKLTHFIDDRVDVLDAMAGIVANRILFIGGSNHDNHAFDDSIVVFDNWKAILEYIKTDA